ncbi:MAG TPA: phenylalanine--tRNA ligase subunit beta, partial [Clostridia bacterium]|nr:phenylalanine--tRNA ligase subunit beta [Clostridia bacterium]
MKASLNWLREYVDINIPVAELAEKLIMNGLEVEGWESKADEITGVVVGRIEKIEKHPNADKLSVCQVNTGDCIKQIVTGADNVFEGAYVPVALAGAKLANGLVIKEASLRGVASSGMLCSGEELALTEDDYKGAGIHGILILEGEITLGENIWKALGMDDVIMDFKVTANRPDCHSIIGLAREISVALDTPLRLPAAEFSPNVNGSQTVFDV